MAEYQPLFSADEIASRVDALADVIAAQMEPDAVLAALMSGACLFAADLLRALYRRGINPRFEALQFESYHDSRTSSGRVQVRADFARSVAGLPVWIIDDVFDSGATLAFAAQHARAQGARDVHLVALVQKPWPQSRAVMPDLVGFEAPAVFLAGYGMDVEGRFRGCPDIVIAPH